MRFDSLPDSESAAWQLQPLELRFMIGDWLLSRVRVPAAFLTTHVSRLGDDPGEHLPMLAALGEGVEALVMPSHPVADEPKQFHSNGNVLVYVPSRHDHHTITLDGDMAAYLGARPKKHRHEIVRKLRRFSEITGQQIDCRICRTPDEIAEFFILAEPVARMTYQERLMKVGMPLDEAFRRAAIEAAARDAVRGFLLNVNGQPIAFGYCRAEGDRLEYGYTGYDPGARDLAPGYVLMHRIIEAAFAEGRYNCIDLGYGDAQYKRYFATESRRCATVHVYRNSVRNRVLIAMHRLCNAVSDGTAGALDRLGLKAALKRRLRG